LERNHLTSTPDISFQLRQAFMQSIAQKIGLEIREVEQNNLEQKIWQRIKALQLTTPEQYYQFLQVLGTESDREWQHLAELLTNNESYFFRDREQLNLLRNQIFPQLIRQKRQQEDLTLRVWSAGCSTGQEPYSLAIILRELLLDLDAWDLTIFGTDIDLAALNQARAGIYSDWSFRNTEPRIKRRYFQAVARNYQIEPLIRQMVTFQKLNLLTDSFPQLFSHLRDIDLIVCRNVFIYFGSSTIGEILAKFYNTLRPAGYLLVGHSELTGQNLSRFQAQFYPQSLIYQRREVNSMASSASLPSIKNRQQSILEIAETPPIRNRQSIVPNVKGQNAPSCFIPQKTEILEVSSTSVNRLLPNLPPNSVPTLETVGVAQATLTAEDTQQLLQQAEHLWQQKQSNLAIKKAEQLLALQPQNIRACCLLGKIYLELNQIDLAMHMSDRGLAIDPVNLDLHYLLGEIALQQGDLFTAKKVFKKIIYLDAESIKAPIELSRIYQQEGDSTRASKMAQQSIKKLQKLPQSQILPTCNNLTVAEILFELQTN
jgi:chemotaxis protein methyltransferase CheR